jgi:hypothetical protein
LVLPNSGDSSAAELASVDNARAAPGLSPVEPAESFESFGSFESFEAAGCFVPQLLQKASPGTTVTPHPIHSAIVLNPNRLCYANSWFLCELTRCFTANGSFNNVEAEEGLPHNNFVTIVQKLARSRRDSLSAVNKCAVSRS